MRTAITIVLAVGWLIWLVAAGRGVYEKGNGSDIVRLWVVCRYVNSGNDPYSLAKDILIAKYGAGNPGRNKIFFIPKEVPAQRAGDVIPELGPPEATYPAPAIGILALTIGWFPNPTPVVWLWFGVNILALCMVAIGLTRLWTMPPGGGTHFDNRRYVLAALLLFPPTYFIVEVSQFSLLVFALILAANDPACNRVLRGIALGVALMKPSLALPFLLVPLVRREWRIVLVAVAVQALPAAYVAWRTGRTVGLLTDWFAVAGFFTLSGMYTVQDWLALVSPRFPWIVPVASLGIMALCGLTLVVARKLPLPRLVSLAAVTSVFWTYHLGYDFIVLFPVLMALAGWTNSQPGRSWSAIGIALFALLAISFIPAVYEGGDELPIRSLRWCARLIVIGLFVREYVLVLRCAVREAGNTAPS